MGQVQQLYRLQQLDSEIAAKKGRLKEVLTLQRETAALRAARQRAATAVADLQKKQAQLDDLNLEVAGVGDKAKRSEQRLYSGKVTNPKELTDLEQELAALGRRRAVLEDEVLEAMIAVEEAQAENEGAAEDLTAVESAWQTSQSSLQVEQNELAIALHGLIGRREKLAAKVEQKLLADYDALRARKNGLAVVALVDHSCTGCHVRLPENQVLLAERGDLVRCSGCGRMLCPAQPSG